MAISIPIFSGQLEKAREATNAANIRSQYAEVMADAIMDGGAVNKNHSTYEPIRLQQQKNEWQSTGLKTNLEGVFGEIVGDYPKAGGQAWVEFDSSKDYSILHYDGGSGDTGGSGSGNGGSETAPTNPITPPTTPTKPETPAENSTIDKIENAAGIWPTPSNAGTVETGKSYKLPDGTTYIATSTQSYNQYNMVHYPTESGFEWLGVKPSGTVISSDKVVNGKLTVTVNRGDIFENPDGNFYVWKSDSNSWGAPINDQQNWVKLIVN